MFRGLTFTTLPYQGLGPLLSPQLTRQTCLKALVGLKFPPQAAPSLQLRFLLRWAKELFQKKGFVFAWAATANLLSVALVLAHCTPLKRRVAALSSTLCTPVLAGSEPSWVYTKPRRYVLGHWITALGNLDAGCTLASWALRGLPLQAFNGASSGANLFL